MNSATSASRPTPVVIHGTAVSLDGRGVLLIGPSGCGKSDLGLRLVDAGARLIADDAVRILPCDAPQRGRCLMTALSGGNGRMMVRDIGVIRLAADQLADTACPLCLVVDLKESRGIDSGFARLSAWSALPDRKVPLISLPAFDLTSVRKLHLALERWGH